MPDEKTNIDISMILFSIWKYANPKRVCYVTVNEQSFVINKYIYMYVYTFSVKSFWRYEITIKYTKSNIQNHYDRIDKWPNVMNECVN